MFRFQGMLSREEPMFSLTAEIIEDIFEYAKPLGHNQKPETMNLGFGFLYYGLVRALRPKHVLVIGSGYGFSVVCLALGLRDNREGRLSFVDPSYSLSKDGPFKTIGGRNAWSDPDRVRAHFARFGLQDIVQHYKMTSQDFFASYRKLRLPKIHLAFIDGNHSFKDVRADFLGTYRHCIKNAYILLHDTHIYLREMINHSGVKRWLGLIQSQEKCFDAVDFPFDSGVALIRVKRKCIREEDL